MMQAERRWAACRRKCRCSDDVSNDFCTTCIVPESTVNSVAIRSQLMTSISRPVRSLTSLATNVMTCFRSDSVSSRPSPSYSRDSQCAERSSRSVLWYPCTIRGNPQFLASSTGNRKDSNKGLHESVRWRRYTLALYSKWEGSVRRPGPQITSRRRLTVVNPCKGLSKRDVERKCHLVSRRLATYGIGRSSERSKRNVSEAASVSTVCTHCIIKHCYTKIVPISLNVREVSACRSHNAHHADPRERAADEVRPIAAIAHQAI
jgi:hypothetical protein